MQILTTRTYKYRCYPTKSQIGRLENHFSMCRHLYNWSLKERMDSYENLGITVNYHAQAIALPALKVARPWFKNVYSQVLQHTLKRLDLAYQAFFRRVKEGAEEHGFPKFKKRGQWDSITYPQFHDFPEAADPDGTKHFKSHQIRVPKIGTVKLNYHREIPKEAEVKTMSVVKEAGRWFVCFSFNILVDPEPKQKPLAPVGIDMGLIDFFYTSDGERVATPKFLRKKEKQLKRLQRRFSRAEKRSPKYYKLLKALQKCHYRIKCQRTDFLHKQANNLINGYDIIFHEDLSIKNMSRRPKPKTDESGKYVPNGAVAKSGLNKSIADAGWYKFFLFLKHKAKSLGKMTFAVPPAYTSQECSRCHTIVKKSLSTRTHRCPECGYVAPRDLNAALNILRVGMDTFQAST